MLKCSRNLWWQENPTFVGVTGWFLNRVFGMVELPLLGKLLVRFGSHLATKEA